MSLKEQLAADLKDAMRQRDELRRETIRLALAAVHNAEIAAGAALDDDAVAAVLVKEAKQRKESVEEFRNAGRQDMAAKEEAELAILSAYLPQPLTREEIAEAARRIIAETGASGAKDIGKVMPKLMQEVRGRADGRDANEVVRELLSAS